MGISPNLFARDPQDCAKVCENKIAVCENLFKENPAIISSPYVLDNIPPEKMQNIISQKTGSHGKQAVLDGFSEWVITLDPENKNLVLTPNNPILSGKIVLNKKEQIKACEKNQDWCLKTCEK